MTFKDLSGDGTLFLRLGAFFGDSGAGGCGYFLVQFLARPMMEFETRP